MNCLISASVRPWFGIGMLLCSFSIAWAAGSVFSMVSGDLSQRASQSSVRRLVTPARSGPSFAPWPNVWQARHLLSNASLPATASGSVGVASIERSEEHTSELQSLRHLVCRLLLEKKKRQHKATSAYDREKQ